ncbi:MAG: sigma 54-interacting transcriptional regulator [Gemmatimonadota bacterium]
MSQPLPRHLQDQIQACMVQRQNLEAIFDSVADGILAVDAHLRVINLNRATQALSGYGRDEASGLSCLEVLGLPEDDEGLRPVLVERREVDSLPATVTDRHGRRRRLVVSTRLLRDEAGEPQGLVAILRDVTELESMREQLSGRDHFHGLLGRSRRMQEIYQLVEDLADSDATVLILGESGTGKELVAGAVHHASHRRHGPYVKVNCSALSESLLESELFGHVRGAFTGAVRDKIGRFEQASGGTIFLDEIGDLSPAVQVKLLRVLQEREVERVGSGQTLRVDCRVIAATHRDLPGEIAAGRFREDLYYRLNVMPIEVPPLRERTEDIPLIVAHFVDRLRSETGRPIRRLADEALALLMDYPWPGNVRELENSIAHAFIKCRGEVLGRDCLPAFLKTAGGGPLAGGGPVAAGGRPAPPLVADPRRSAAGLPDALDGDERARVLEALRDSRWNRSAAAARLGMHRTTLWRKLREWGI